MSDTANVVSNVQDGSTISSNVSSGVTVSTSVNTSSSVTANVITGGKGDSGSSLASQSSQTASFTATANNYYPVNATASAITVTLPTSVAGQQIAIKKTDASTNIVTISGTINGSVSTIPLRLSSQGKVLISDGSGGWNVIAGDTSLPTLDSRYINQSTGLAGFITAGTNVTITGSGTIASPYVVASTGGTGAVTSVNTRTGAVTGLAEDNTVVHLSGTETITGTKTFSLTPTLSTGATLTAQSPSYTAGKLIFDNTTNSLTFYNSDSNVSLQVGQEEWIQVINNTGSTIANGAAVYISGATSGLPTIALANASAAATTIGAGLATESIANGATGFVTCIGNVNGIDTSAFTAGATVYISATTAGALTSTAPVAPNFRYRIGIVGTSSATVGTIHVTPSTASLGNGSANQIAGINAAGTGQEYKTVSGTQGVSITNTTNSLAVGLGAITPTSVNSVVISGSTTPTLTVTGTTTVSGSNTGDQTTITGNSGTATKLQTARTIGTVTGDATSTGSTFDGSANNTNALTFATVNANVGSFTKGSFTVNAKGLITAASSGTADFITALTTTGTSGNASVTTGTLNIPNYTYTLPTASTTVLGGVKVDGTSITISSGVISAVSGGAGSVTSVSVVTANGFARTVATATSTPAITLTTSITGVLKGNGTAISAATAGTDYQAPITLTTTGTSGAATFTSGTLNIPQYTGNTYTAGTGLTLTTGAFSVNTSQNIATLSNLTTNGIVTTSGGTGALSITGTTGSGSVVLATSPTLVTPTLGAASATSINTVTITGSSTPALTVTGTTSVSGTNTGDQTNVTGSAGTVSTTVSQTAHGFSVGNWIRPTTTANTYTLSQANSSANSVVSGVVTTVVNANQFIFTEKGTAALTGVAGSSYFLDPATAGAMTATSPSTAGQVVKPLYTAVSTTSGTVNVGTGIVVATAGTGNMNTTTYDPAAIAQQVVGTTASQTLTNKTLTSPSIGSQINDTTGAAYLTISAPASAVNFLTSTSAVTTGTPSLGASGSDTNVNLNLTTKGTGRVQAGGVNVVTISSTDTLTNKTYNTAGTGNVFQINGTGITAVTGTGAVALGTSPTIATPSITYTNNSIPAAALATTAITLGYASTTTAFTTTSTTPVQVTSLTLSPTIPAGGRRVEITVSVRSMFNSTAAAYSTLSLWSGTVGTGTLLMESVVQSTIANGENTASILFSHVPSAGAVTYNVGMKVTAGTGNISVGSPVVPMSILVKVI